MNAARRTSVIEVIKELVDENPGITTKRLVPLLEQLGLEGYTRSDVNRVLYSLRPALDQRDGRDGPEWFSSTSSLAPGMRASPPVGSSSRPPAHDELPKLHAWQARALAAWRAAGSHGIVEAVTGAGKTRVALEALIEDIAAGMAGVVIVPTLDLMDQWSKILERSMTPTGRRVRVGRLGGGSADSLRHHDVLIVTAASAARHELFDPRREGILVADEVHHLGAETWSLGLEEDFVHRLGLTATYEREDLGLEEFVTPYFGKIVYSLRYAEALKDGVIAHFRVLFAGCELLPTERAAYDDANEKAGRYRARLINEYGLPAEPFGRFMRAVQVARASGEEGAGKFAGFYLSAFAKRRALLSEATAKFDLLADVAPAIKSADRTIAFANTKVAAHKVVEILGRRGVAGRVLTADMDLDERRGVFAGFEDGEHELVAAPKLLDEGVDVPSADLAIVLASSRSRRQLVQRMGRVIRPKPDGREARVLILFTEGTSEDPALGANEDFLDEIVASADDVSVIRQGVPPGEIVKYLDVGGTSSVAEPLSADARPPTPRPSADLHSRLSLDDAGLIRLMQSVLVMTVTPNEYIRKQIESELDRLGISHVWTDAPSVVVGYLAGPESGSQPAVIFIDRDVYEPGYARVGSPAHDLCADLAKTWDLSSVVPVLVGAGRDELARTIGAPIAFEAQVSAISRRFGGDPGSVARSLLRASTFLDI